MKMALAWHKQCLGNMRQSLARHELRVTMAQRDRDHMAEYVAVLSSQIARAEAEGKDGFDGDKYGKKRT